MHNRIFEIIGGAGGPGPSKTFRHKPLKRGEKKRGITKLLVEAFVGRSVMKITINSGGFASEVAEVGTQPFVGRVQRLWNDAGFADDRNKIRISKPPGKNVHVKVLFNAGSGSAAHIESHVESVGVVLLPQGIFAVPAQGDEFEQFLFRSIV